MMYIPTRFRYRILNINSVSLMVFHSHRIYGTGIFSYIYHKHQLNVGKYTSPMDPMGLVFTIKFPFSQQGSPGVFRKFPMFRTPLIFPMNPAAGLLQPGSSGIHMVQPEFSAPKACSLTNVLFSNRFLLRHNG